MQWKILNTKISSLLYLLRLTRAQSWFDLVAPLSPEGHGNHNEDSPFLGADDAAGRRSDFYDRNLALFEVTPPPPPPNLMQLNMILMSSLPSTSRRSWTSDQRSPLCLVAWSTTPTSRKEPKSTRRRKAPPAERPPRSGGVFCFSSLYHFSFQVTGWTGMFSTPPPSQNQLPPAGLH